jgi:outer membrane protein assembly factor BamE (lipoprotein component of BamABCDE complex)
MRLTGFVLFLAACAPTVDLRGFNPEHGDVKAIQPRTDTMDTVREKLGSPSLVSTFPDNTAGAIWYYVYKKTSTTSFYKPETLDQRTVVITFDKDSKVQTVTEKDGEHVIDPNPNRTESDAYETSAMRDVFGNFSRYSNKKPNAK